MCLTHSESKQTKSEKGLLQDHARRWVALALKALGSLKGFHKALLKARQGRVGHRVCDQFMQFSNVLLARLVPQQLILSVLGLQEAWG